MRQLRPYLIFILGLVALDQFTKFLITQSFVYGESVPILPFFNLVRAHNEGAAFSFLADHASWGRYFLLIIGLIISAVLAHWMYRVRENKLLSFLLASILGGAIGNLIDRAYLGYVVDFLDFYIGSWHWPAFNVADSSISVGVISLLVYEFINARQQSRTASNK